MNRLKRMIAGAIMGIMAFACSSNDNNDSSSNNANHACEMAAANVTVAAAAYNSATSANFAERCVAYKAALQAQISACGDASGALQAAINTLGDCTVAGNTGSITVTAGSSARNFNSNITVTTTGTVRHVRAEESATGYYIEFDVASGATGAGALSNFNIHLITSDYNPLPVSEGGNFTSNITVNTAAKITGTFYGIVTSPTTGADIDLNNGVINIDVH